jgi:hypothetical protein
MFCNCLFARLCQDLAHMPIRCSSGSIHDLPALAHVAGVHCSSVIASGRYRLIHSACRGPWCVTRVGVRACDIPVCGGARAGDVPHVLTFEEEEEVGDETHTANFQELDGIRPQIDSSTAFCGRKSLYFPNRCVCAYGCTHGSWCYRLEKAP